MNMEYIFDGMLLLICEIMVDDTMMDSTNSPMNLFLLIDFIPSHQQTLQCVMCMYSLLIHMQFFFYFITIIRVATVLISPGWLEPGFRFQTGTGNPGSTRIRYDPYFALCVHHSLQ